MKIVILDGYTENPGDLSWSGLEAFGELTVYDRTSLNDDDEIVRRIGDARNRLHQQDSPGAARSLSTVRRCGSSACWATGYNIVDVAAADDHDVTVCNIPSYGTDAVAQFAHCDADGDLPRRGAPQSGRTRGPLGKLPRISASGTHRRSN